MNCPPQKTQSVNGKTSACIPGFFRSHSAVKPPKRQSFRNLLNECGGGVIIDGRTANGTVEAKHG
jgi:hypothetical protein